MLPPALANFVNTLKRDVHETREKIEKLFHEAARLRVADDRTLYEHMDALEIMINARFLDLWKTGKLAEIAKVSLPAQASEPKSSVNFPTPGN